PNSGLAFDVRDTFDTIEFDGNAGDDTLTVDNTNGLIDNADGIVFNGGSGQDLLQLIGNSSISTTYNPGPTNDAGVITQMDDADDTQTVAFTGREPIQVLGNGIKDTLTIGSVVSPQALNANNAINYS